MNCCYCTRPLHPTTIRNGNKACYSCRSRIRSRKNRAMGRLLMAETYNYLKERAENHDQLG